MTVRRLRAVITEGDLVDGRSCPCGCQDHYPVRASGGPAADVRQDVRRAAVAVLADRLVVARWERGGRGEPEHTHGPGCVHEVWRAWIRSGRLAAASPILRWRSYVLFGRTPWNVRTLDGAWRVDEPDAAWAQLTRLALQCGVGFDDIEADVALRWAQVLDVLAAA